MGNCLNCVGSGQQDSTNLLTNSPDPTYIVDSSRDIFRPSLPYNEIASDHYPSSSVREHSAEVGMSHSIGVGVGLGTVDESTINDEEHQVRMVKRLGLIQHLPTRQFNGTKKAECVICMMELVTGEEVRYLPCMHTYHALCIDDWLLRSLTCPTCMEPVDAALINSYHPTT